MPDCFSCDCTPVLLYDANRVAPGAATENEVFDNVDLVVDWMNENRDFFSFEHNLNTQEASFLEPFGIGDSYGPHKMQTSGTWQDFPLDVNSGRSGIGGGTVTFFDVPAYEFALETEIFAADENQGTTTCSVFGESWEYKAHELSTTPGDNPNVFWLFMPDVGRQFRQFTLTAFGTTRTVRESNFLTVGQIVTSVYTPFDYETNSQSPLHICVHRATSNLISWTGFPNYTSQINRPDVWKSLGVRSGNGNYVKTGYFNAPVEIRSFGRVMVTRDGSTVLEALRPTQAESFAATQEEGVYFVTSYVDETTDTASTLPYRRRYPRPLKQFASFVVDRVAPVFGYAALGDCYDTDTGVSAARDMTRHFCCTKPAGDFDFFKAGDPASGTIVFEGDGSNSPPNAFFGDFQEFRFPDTSAGTLDYPTAALTDELDATPLDDAGNLAEYYPQTYTVHATPANGHLGAIPSIQDPSRQTRPIGRARYQHETVSRLALVFDRVVDPDTVNDSQVTLYKNGEVVAGCTLEKTGTREWDIVLPESADQSSRSFWLLEYDPGGQVFTDDVRVEKYPPGFNLPEEGRYRIIYEQTTSDGTTTRYSWSEEGYIDIGDDEYPKDENGVDYEPEPCVIAARVSWLMADFDGWRRPLDCSSTTINLKGTASISVEREELQDFTQDVSFTLNDYSNLVLTEPWGQFKRGDTQDGFTPQVPYGDDAPDNCSYFGLTTTIDPCPPALLHCPVPSAAQPHASLVRSAEFTQLRVKLFLANPIETVLTNMHPVLENTVTSQNAFFGIIDAQEAEDGNFFPSQSSTDYPEGVPFFYIGTATDGLRNSGLYLKREIAGGYHLLLMQRDADEYQALKTTLLHELKFEINTTLTYRYFERNPEQPYTNIAYAGEFESDIVASNLINETPGVIYKSLDVLGLNFGKFRTWKNGEGFVDTDSELGPAYDENGNVIVPIETPDEVLQYVPAYVTRNQTHAFSEEQEQALAAGEIVQFGDSNNTSVDEPDYELQAIFE